MIQSLSTSVAFNRERQQYVPKPPLSLLRAPQLGRNITAQYSRLKGAAWNAIWARPINKMNRLPRPSVLALTIVGAAFARGATAHEHHGDNIPEGDFVSPDPIVRILERTRR